MLESIYIENFAIIDRLEVDFHNHMTVLTGETGAGKSIIIDAIGQLMGNRSQSSFIKADCDECFIEGVFIIGAKSPVLNKLKEYRIDYEDKLVVSKSFNRDNKSIIKINYRNVSKMVLQSIMADLIDIHSQFETHSLFDAENHLIILDEFINQPLKKLFQTYSLAYRTYREINRDYQKALNEELSDEQLEFYQAQLAEINSLDLEELDEDELEREKKLLQSYEKTNEQISKYRQYMNGDRGALATLSNALSELEELNDNPQYQNTYERMYDLYYNLIDLDDEIINEFNSTNFDEYRLNEIQEVFFKLNRLKRKYGQSIEAIKEAKEDLEMKVAAFNNREAYLNDLKKQLDIAYQETKSIAEQITRLRQSKAKEFTELVTKELKSLYLDKVVFKVDFKLVDFQKNGQDNVEFLISTNAGQTLKPLNKVASGGEMSRIMLAIKILSLSSSSVETIIFDEADTGVSGKVAESIGAKMKYISKQHQVLCITHLAQVAAFAKNHYLIQKSSNDNYTNVKIKELSYDQSINEIAKLISGKEVSQESINHAKKLKISSE
ncbi:DNA repair protein RecN [Thomasclavelia ramosa]|uniref:DNA repair protein RecN n=1 Tax=Thomasclavelia ramosa TaxID=1547 RepID=UPI002030C4ED|nr:DNA repair protein RecN [Thomasclavelia ramosa]MCM1647434.1 DNA repair protein RecN [Thomasclavelia ramosa]